MMHVFYLFELPFAKLLQFINIIYQISQSKEEILHPKPLVYQLIHNLEELLLNTFRDKHIDNL